MENVVIGKTMENVQKHREKSLLLKLMGKTI